MYNGVGQYPEVGTEIAEQGKNLIPIILHKTNSGWIQAFEMHTSRECTVEVNGCKIGTKYSAQAGDCVLVIDRPILRQAKEFEAGVSFGNPGITELKIEDADVEFYIQFYW